MADGSDKFQQGFRVVGFGHVMQKTAFCRQASRDLAVVRRHRDQSRAVQASTAEVQGDLESAAVRHFDIKEDDVGTEFVDRPFHFRAFVHKPDIHSLASQKDAQRHKRIAPAICDQYTHHRRTLADATLAMASA
jgi:hypothetical protein